MARETMLQAAADLIAENGIEALSIGDVAERAGVSKRTLYNYFENREALFADLSRWSEELTLKHGGYLMPEGLDQLPTMVQAVWRTWALQGTVFQAVIQIDAASYPSGISDARRRRQSAITKSVRDIRPDLEHDRANEISALIHSISSAPVFQRLTSKEGLDVDTAGSLVGWAIAAVHAALKRGEDPFSVRNHTTE